VEQPTPQDALESMYEILGYHPGCRAGHAKGTFCGGVFTPTTVAREFTRAPHLQEHPVEATVRFSNISGDPDRPDGAKNTRGMATRFYLDEGSYTDLVALTLPCFPNRNPHDFVEMNGCFKRSGERTRMRLAIVPFVLRHPESFRAITARQLIKPVPSYANSRYNALNAFMWINETGDRCYVRYSWLPEEGQVSISQYAASHRAPDYLQRDLYERLGRTPARPVRFQLNVQLASQEDLNKKRVTDPTAVWPRRPKRIVPALADTKHKRFFTAGVLELTHLEEGLRGPPDELFFNPTHVPDGIEPSGDKILHFRPHVYRLSFQNRTRPGNRKPS
jgi:catalase